LNFPIRESSSLFPFQGAKNKGALSHPLIDLQYSEITEIIILYSNNNERENDRKS